MCWVGFPLGVTGEVFHGAAVGWAGGLPNRSRTVSLAFVQWGDRDRATNENLYNGSLTSITVESLT